MIIHIIKFVYLCRFLLLQIANYLRIITHLTHLHTWKHSTRKLLNILAYLNDQSEYTTFHCCIRLYPHDLLDLIVL